MNEETIRRIAREEIARQGSQNRFQLSPLQRHAHTGSDSPKISQANVIPATRTGGSITMATDGRTYRLTVVSNPSRVDCFGVAVHKSGGAVDIRAHFTGVAFLGPSWYFQPDTESSVVAGGVIQPNWQGCSQIYIAGATVKATSTQFHIVDIFNGAPSLATLVARATVTKSDSTSVYVEAKLADGWEIDANWAIS